MDILVNVANQKLKIAANLKSLVKGTQEFIRFVYNLNGDWDGLTVFAQFIQDGVAYNQLLDSENSAYLPAEIGAGTVTMMLYGSGGNTIATTNYLTLTVDDNIFVQDAQSTEITQSLYQQLVNTVQTYTTYTDRLQGQIDLKASIQQLQSEIQRATDKENELTASLDAKADKSDVTDLQSMMTSSLDAKADKSDVTDLQSRITSLENNAVADFIAYTPTVKEDIENAVISYLDDNPIITGDGSITTIVKLTQAEYDALEELSSTTLYVIEE